MEHVGVLVVVAVLAAGCFSSRKESRTDPFVTDIRFVGDRMVVDSCAIDYEKTTDHFLWESSTTRSVSTDGCASSFEALPPGIRPPEPPRMPRPRPGAAPGDVDAPDTPAMTFTRRARQAATAGDCALVRRLAIQVRANDADFYARVFLTDPELTACLDGGTP